MIMKKGLWLVLTWMLTFTFWAAESVAGLPLHIKKIGADIIRVWAGDYATTTAVTAVATRKGIVVIDTTDLPELDRAFRRVIARELKRDDFRYLINTHGHGDHTNGNTVYADCQIIAHQAVPAMMQENSANFAWLTEHRRESISRQMDQLAAGKLTETQQAAGRESLVLSKLRCEFTATSPRLCPPGHTFQDKMKLDCGDLTFELYQVGGTHTRSDIFILIPQKKILFTGDMMADKWLTDNPGCLAKFILGSGDRADFSVLMKNWQLMIDRQNEIDLYLTGHWNSELSREGFVNRFEYAKTLLNDIQALAASQGSLEQFAAAYTLKTKFPRLVGSPGMSDENLLSSIQHLYLVYSGKTRVSDSLKKIIGSPDFDVSFERMKTEILTDKTRYFFDEAGINSIGYTLLRQHKQTERAIRVFEYNCELFPASVNACDSLAEAWKIKGDKLTALKYYRRASELDPSNRQIQDKITELEKE